MYCKTYIWLNFSVYQLCLLANALAYKKFSAILIGTYIKLLFSVSKSLSTKALRLFVESNKVCMRCVQTSNNCVFFNVVSVSTYTNQIMIPETHWRSILLSSMAKVTKLGQIQIHCIIVLSTHKTYFVNCFMLQILVLK